MTRERAAREHARRVTEAVERATVSAHRLILPLSGGLDGRHIALPLQELGKRVTAYVTTRHLPWWQDEDVRVDTHLASILGSLHIVVAQPNAYVGNIVRTFRRTGFCSLRHARSSQAGDL
jgi:asparagine synthetase B (glutamine-hydrolysing)